MVVHGIDDVVSLFDALLMMMVLMGRVSHLLGQHRFLEVLTLCLLVRVGARGLMLRVESIVVDCVGGMVDRR